LDWLRLVSSVPRSRRVVIDCDGRYNDLINVHGDFNHRTEAESTAYMGFCDAVADKIYQPSPTPLRPNVGTFLFHIYDPAWEAPLDFSAKDFSIVYVGHSKFRWHGMAQVLRAVEPVRSKVGRIGLFGYGWDRQPDWAAQASPKYLEMAQKGRQIPAARLWQILEQVKQLRRDSVALFEDIDVIVLPAAAALPWKAEDAYPTHIAGQEVGPRGHAVYTGWVNAAGLPGLALPCAPSREGLPIGMQLIGRYGSDDMLLELGAAYEAAHPWADRWPAL
jgi:Asp-tRNA(Asn)/Glu-tRNA(Gln) amidotransferase A subunit family amidase